MILVRLKPFYLFLAAFSAAFAVAMIIYFDPIAESGSVKNLMWITFVFLMLDAVLSIILAFTRGRDEKRSGQKPK